MKRDLSKTFSFLALHLIVGFTVAYLFTGSWMIAGGIALVEPLVLLLMGGIVLMMVLAILLPIINLNDLVTL